MLKNGNEVCEIHWMGEQNAKAFSDCVHSVIICKGIHLWDIIWYFYDERCEDFEDFVRKLSSEAK